MDWNKVSNVAQVGAFILAIPALGFVIYDHLPQQANQGGSGMTPWIIPAVLVGLVVLAAVLHVVAARTNVRAHKINPAKEALVKGSETECPDRWLHDIAEAQKKSIVDYVQVECFFMNFDLLNDSFLFIEFRFRVDSACVYTLSLRRIEGHIHFNNKPLAAPPKVISNELNPLTIGRVGWVTVRQNLKVEEAASILNQDAGFTFPELQIELNAEPGGIESGTLNIYSTLGSRRMREGTPQLKLEVVETRAEGLYDREEHPGEQSPVLGSVLNVRVKIKNPRPAPIEIKRIILLIPTGQELHVPAQPGQICDITLLQHGEIKQTRNPLKNLNNCPIYLDPQSETVEGWLQFIVRETNSLYWANGNSVTLMALDSRGEEHRHSFDPARTLTQTKT